MNYFISRNGQQFGPYTLADLQRYVAQGSILPTDLSRSEGMQGWLPVAQVIGTVAVPVGPSGAAVAPAYGAAPAHLSVQQPATGPLPVSLHWGVVLLLAIVSFGIFGIVWIFVEAGFVKKIQPRNNAIIYLALYIGAVVIAAALSTDADTAPLAGVLQLAGIVLYLVAVFSMKSALEDYYTSVEPIGLVLSGAMTFFFNILYFQYHLTRIATWKRTGQLTPQ